MKIAVSINVNVDAQVVVVVESAGCETRDVTFSRAQSLAAAKLIAARQGYMLVKAPAEEEPK